MTKSTNIVEKRFEWIERHKVHARPVKNARCIICDKTSGSFRWNKDKLGYECSECLSTINTSLKEFGDDDIPIVGSVFCDGYSEDWKATRTISLGHMGNPSEKP